MQKLPADLKRFFLDRTTAKVCYALSQQRPFQVIFSMEKFVSRQQMRLRKLQIRDHAFYSQIIVEDNYDPNGKLRICKNWNRETGCLRRQMCFTDRKRSYMFYCSNGHLSNVTHFNVLGMSEQSFCDCRSSLDLFTY
jgi:hypothetical protein